MANRHISLVIILSLSSYVSCRSRVHRVDDTLSYKKNGSLEYEVINFNHDLSSSPPPSQNHFYRTRIYHNYEHWKNCWVDLYDSGRSQVASAVTDGSQNIEVSLSFPFTFYGQGVDKISISSRGFVHVGDGKVPLSYIAPFMTTSSSHENTILYHDNGTSLTVQWEKLKLTNIGSTFTFQLTLFDDGVITFAYKTVPLSARELTLKLNAVTVGLAGISEDGMNDQMNLLEMTYIANQTCILLMPLQNYYHYDVESETGDDETWDVSPVHVHFKDSGTRKHKREVTAGHEFEEASEDGDDFADATVPPGSDQDRIMHDHHFYYNSTMYMEKEKWDDLWIDLDTVENKNIHLMLSNSYRKGVTVPLSFDFPFYGHRIRNITITTGGFLFTGSQVHSWLAATQYIAPLMANFDPSLQNFSVIKYIDNGTALTVQWENVTLKDKLQGNFTFQVTLLNTGDIAFVYKEVPLSVLLISDDDHPVKVGLSDAYIIDRTIFFMRRKTIYEYHRVDFKKASISNTTSIYFTALPTCVGIKDCNMCLKASIGFECGWCSGRCSDGIDRNRQDWILQGCGQQGDSQACPETDTTDFEQSEASKSGPGITLPGVSSTLSEVTSTLSSLFTVSQSAPNGNATRSFDNVSSTQNSQGPVDAHRSAEKFPGDVDHVSLGTAGIIGVLFVVSMIVAFMVWVFYAYRNPHTASGQLLIRYRPNQWHWPRSEAGYTAASVHM